MHWKDVELGRAYGYSDGIGRFRNGHPAELRFSIDEALKDLESIGESKNLWMYREYVLRGCIPETVLQSLLDYPFEFGFYILRDGKIVMKNGKKDAVSPIEEGSLIPIDDDGGTRSILTSIHTHPSRYNSQGFRGPSIKDLDVACKEDQGISGLIFNEGIAIYHVPNKDMRAFAVALNRYYEEKGIDCLRRGLPGLRSDERLTPAEGYAIEREFAMKYVFQEFAPWDDSHNVRRIIGLLFPEAYLH